MEPLVACGGLVERGIEILAVPFAQGKPYAEADDCLDPRTDAVIHDSVDVFGGVVYEWQERAEPYDRGDSLVAARAQDLKAAARGAYPRLDNPAEPVVRRGERHLHDGFCRAVDMRKDVKVAEHEIRFGLYGHPETMTVDYLQASPHEAQLLFRRDVGVAHRAGSYHAAAAFFPQGLLQKLRCIPLDLNVLEGVLELVAAAPRVAVDAAVGAAAVDVHAPRGQD